jgi:Tfp pilus assembly protein PilP
MKRTITLTFLLLLSIGVVAQTTTVAVPKPATKASTTNSKPAAPAKAAPAATTPAKPSPATVKVVPVTAKPAVAVAKQGVASAQPPPKAVAVPVAKPNTTVAAKPAVVPVAVSAKPVAVSASKTGAHPLAVAAKPASNVAKAPVTPAKPGMTKIAVAPQSKDPFKGTKPVAAAKAAPAQTVAVNDAKSEEKNPAPKKVSAAGRRDPFVSPVVAMGATGSGCSTGKRCLAIDQIALRGVVRSDNGMIAVVVNAMDKAYFLRENDPVFNGYVEKITGDSIVFKETFRDRLGKALTRDVTKTISRPVA